MNVLIIEDDPAIARPLRQWFREAGIECVWAADGDKGLELACSQKYDVVILDLLLPGRGGLETLRTLRSEQIGIPVIVLTALGSVDDRTVGLKAGADDYLVKPFSVDELMARIQAICRRYQDRPSPVITVGKVTIDRATRRLTRSGVTVDLSPTEYRLVEFLMKHADQLVTRQMLFEHLWDASSEGHSYVIDVHVNRLHHKIDRGFEHSLIQTVRGRGYVLRSS